MPEMLLCETMSLGKMLLVLGNHVIKVILVGKVKQVAEVDITVVPMMIWRRMMMVTMTMTMMIWPRMDGLQKFS